ncbi:helix-turn-helix domain-containing protein [Deinococcus cavernae]|uniref:Helix-turn-helix domain-containing protein n=1 Tax=Deinococcus cavernae TaxID=2320857 RepID=A0A418VED1_9DEIO|nr:helix-turn-helix domain-containing protein [Deinococcus cavernae]RJF74467.1 helix-turn-helix domain-containing protein [Deinococcus cavernae]
MGNIDRIAEAWTNVDAVAHHLLTPIETEAQYQNALGAVDELMTRVNEADIHPHPLESLLSILIDHVAAYEDAIMPPRAKRPAGVLAYLMEDRSLTQSALAAAVGIDQSTISKLLKEERAFSAAHARKLSAYFGVDASAFL